MGEKMIICHLCEKGGGTLVSDSIGHHHEQCQRVAVMVGMPRKLRRAQERQVRVNQKSMHKELKKQARRDGRVLSLPVS